MQAMSVQQSRRVLYIDDDEALLDLYTRVFTRAGHRLTGYADPRMALEALRAEPAAFDLVVSDLNMPHMSGEQVAMAVREMRPEMPVVIVSYGVTGAQREVLLRGGVRAVLSKSDMEKLREMIGTLA